MKNGEIEKGNDNMRMCVRIHPRLQIWPWQLRMPFNNRQQRFWL